MNHLKTRAPKLPRTYLRFRRSDGFFLNPHKYHKRHAPMFVHPWTGVGEINFFAQDDIHKADVVVPTKAPLPFPESDALGGNWTQAMDRGTWVGEEKAILILKAAQVVTEQVWLPELMESLVELRQEPASFDQLVVWKGGWRIQPDCSMSEPDLDDRGYVFYGEPGAFDWQAWWESPGDGPPPLPEQPTLQRIMYTDPISRGWLNDPHSLFYNLQMVLQNHLLRTEVLPRLGIVYLDLETHMAIWRSGLVGSGDCLRPCLPSPGFSLENAFIGGLQTVMAWGWDGDGRRDTWIGPNYVPYTEREGTGKKKEGWIRRNRQEDGEMAKQNGEMWRA
jgi:hypothetical protein